MINYCHYKCGSTWLKADLHIHTPGTKLNDNYKCKENEDIWEIYCKKLEESDIQVFGITDYFSVGNYFKFIEKF